MDTFKQQGEPATVTATVVRGHRVASGLSGDERFPGGTLRMQRPFFRKWGLDLSDYFPGTLNLSIASMRYELIEPAYTFRNVKWHPTEPAEDFSFFHCSARAGGDDDFVEGLVYYPHPDTKPEHEQPEDVLEVLLRKKLPGIDYGSRIELRVDPTEMTIKGKPDSD